MENNIAQRPWSQKRFFAGLGRFTGGASLPERQSRTQKDLEQKTQKTVCPQMTQMDADKKAKNGGAKTLPFSIRVIRVIPGQNLWLPASRGDDSTHEKKRRTTWGLWR